MPTGGLLNLVGLALAALLVAGLALIGALSLLRGTPVSGVRALDAAGPHGAAGPGFATAVELLTGIELEPGHTVEILANGDETYPRLLADLAAADSVILFQVFWARPGRLADALREVLAERARAGVRVLFLPDAFGTSALGDGYLDSLRAAGVEVARFRPVRWHDLHKAQNRSHTRVVVVDGAVAYTGGFGIDDAWLGDGASPGSWRDTNARFTGPAVRRHAAAFLAAWAEATGTLAAGPPLLPLEPDVEGRAAARSGVAGILFHQPSIGSTAAERLVALSVAGARRTLYIANAYFVPDDDQRRMLRDAARRGVDVRVLLPAENSDQPSTWLAARAHLEELIEAGVRVYRHQPDMMHAKTLVADGAWSIVGTLNFDNRSMAMNDEVALVSLDPAVGSALDSLFLADLRRSQEIRLDELRRRSWLDRLRERGALLLSRVI